MNDSKGVRIDKFLWAVRLFKTRGMASDACRMNRILVNGSPVKPSRDITGNEIITFRKPPALFLYKVIMPVENRQPAKLVSNYIEDRTSDAEKAKLEVIQAARVGYRKKGSGRPTKKERRIIDKWHDDLGDG
ncbi:MAG: S4 domain-containing protein [Bacteroidales bacterium]